MPCSRNHLSDKTGGRMRPPLFFAEKRLKMICTPKVGLNNQLIKVQIFYD
ncbi:hypothetical protein [Avibacterium paragallinarum]